MNAPAAPLAHPPAAQQTAATIEAELAELADEFEMLGDWEERYRHVIDMGRALPPLTDEERSESNKVRGCASQVWLISAGEAARLWFRGDSDAHIVRGLIAILLRLYSGRSAADILAFDAQAALGRLGLTEALSRQRSNGLASMVERIRRDAQRSRLAGDA
jgi:cysteine desulfuration protein SufE